MKRFILLFTVMATTAIIFVGCATTGYTQQRGPALTLGVANEIFDSIPWDKNEGWIISDTFCPAEILKPFYDRGFRYYNYSETAEPMDMPMRVDGPNYVGYYYYKSSWSFNNNRIIIKGGHDYLDEYGSLMGTSISLVFVQDASDYAHINWLELGEEYIWNSYEFYRDGAGYKQQERP